ncbi:MAG: DMT family transporter [Candidatus Pacearchaeota archaeon]|nr:DMT family transporter [Candidatus Pacearchaeota archaeon]
MIYLPVLGALSFALGTIFQKMVLVRKRINIRFYQTAEFFAIVLAMLPLIYFFWGVDADALSFKNLFIFGLVIVFSVVANLFTYYSMKWEKVSNIEPAKILEPLFVIILAIFFSYLVDNSLFERNLNVVIPAFIAGAALVFSHIEKHHLRFNKYFIAAILGSFFFALELVISRLILDFYSPITFYFLRCLSIFILSLVVFRPKMIKISGKVKWHIVLMGILWTAYRVIVYYGYTELGVIFTTLVIMLAPVFIYLFAYFFLKEELKWKNIVAAVVIVLSVIYVVWIDNFIIYFFD